MNGLITARRNGRVTAMNTLDNGRHHDWDRNSRQAIRVNHEGDCVSLFRKEMEHHGLRPPESIVPGKFMRFPGVHTSDQSVAGYCKEFEDGTGGIFGDFSSGLKGTWQANQPLNEAERRVFKQKVEAAREQARKEIKACHAQAAKKATILWKQAMPAGADHPYLVKKKVKPTATLREINPADAKALLGFPPKRGDQVLIGRLLVVPVKVSGQIASLEFIDENGLKTALAGGARAGGYWATGPLPKGDGADETLLLGEGVATALSASEATGYPALAALSCGNLRAVAAQLRSQYPKARLIILGEPGNGQSHAEEAAQSADGLALWEGGDINDLHVDQGLDAARELIEKAGLCKAETTSRRTPIPLPELPPVEPFDLRLLPDALRAWVMDIVERMGCPPDFVAVGVMTALASVIGRKLGIRPQAQTDWTVICNLWGFIVGRPGVLKSPALEAALAALNRLVAQAMEDFTRVMEEYKKLQALAKLRAEAAEKAVKKILRDDPHADVSALLAVEEPDVPTLRRLKTNDTTPASLGELLRQNPNGLLVYRDEMVSLLRGLDREDQAEGRGFFLTAWNGDSPYTFDRIGRGLNLHIEAACISMLGGTQPGRLAEYIRHAVKGGAADDGLIQRFGLLVWPDPAGSWKEVDRPPNIMAKNEAFAVFANLDRLDLEAIGAEQDKDLEGNPEGVPYLRFAPDALALFREWRNELEARLRKGDLHPALESHFAKYRKLIPALALIIHLADGGTGPVSRVATLQALGWGDYLESHARRAYGAIAQPEVTAAKAILARINKGDLPQSFSSRDVWRQGWSMLSDRHEVASALDMLVDYGYLHLERKETGGRPATIYHFIAGAEE